jgi:hypothetical protein
MPLNKTALKAALKSAFEANITNITPAQDSQVDALCGSISDAIDNYIKAATINYTTGLVAPNGPVTGVFTGTLN